MTEVATATGASGMLTTATLAARLSVSEDTALRLMQKTPGVVRLGSGARTLYRMPEKVYEAMITRASKQATKGGRS